MTRAAIISIFLLIMTGVVSAQTGSLKISAQKEPGSFAIHSGGNPAQMLISGKDEPGVIRAFRDLQQDIKSVTANLPVLSLDQNRSHSDLILAGTIGKSPIIADLIKRNKIKVDDISGKWESFIIQVVDKPFPDVAKALVIAGSDKRGTIYGIYEISGKMGVSPWYWWADVVPEKKSTIFFKEGRYEQSPSVKYRGISKFGY